MGVTSSVGRVAWRHLALGILLDRGGVKQRGNDRRRTDPDGNACLDQLGSPFLVAVFVAAHSILSILFAARPYALRPGLGSAG